MMTLARLSLVALAIIILVALFLVTFGRQEIQDPALRTIVAEHRTLVAALTATPPATAISTAIITPRPVRSAPECSHLQEGSTITPIEMRSEYGYLEKIIICVGRTLRAIHQFDDRGDVVREDLYHEGLLRIQFFYENGKLRKTVQFDQYGNLIEDQIIIIPVPIIRPY